MTRRAYDSLADYLSATGKTQEQLAAELSELAGRKVSQSRISQWVAADAMPRTEMAILISQHTGVTVEAMARAYAAKKAAA